jgi:topoisomerase-4 subunit A
VLDRIHVLEGRQQVLLNIDEVIRIIRNADEPKGALIERFALSERQADDILEIRLRQLARLEAIKLEQELKELRADQSKLDALLGDAAALRRAVIKEIEADVKQFGSAEKDPRRTLIQAEKKAVVEVRVVDEPVTVVVSQKGWVRTLKGHDNEVSALQFKSGDTLLATFACRSVDVLLVFGSAAGGSGRVYSTPVAGLPGGRGDGQPITTLIDLEAGTQPAHYHAGALAQTLLLANSGGYGLMARVGDLVARQRGGKAFLTLEEGEQVLPPSLVDVDDAGEALSRVACLSAQGRLLVFTASELKRQPQGGRGLTLIDLDDGDALASAVAFTGTLQVIGTGRGGKAREEVLKPAGCAPYVGKRARKGRAQDLMPKALTLRAI